MWRAFWAWYERTYLLQVGTALALFLFQVVHLVWLFGEVVWEQFFGLPLFVLSPPHQLFVVFIDYIEIPTLISVSLVYLNELRQRWSGKNTLYLLLLNSQWFHLFWITDEFVVTTFNSGGTVLPVWLAWVAIGIDYLELPVMYDTTHKFFSALRTRSRIVV